MKANIYSHTKLIGTADLQVGDESMGCVFGSFIPNEIYYKEVQKQVWKFWKTNKPNYKAWNSLRINVQLENGCFLYPSGGYTFDDNSDDPLQIKQIEIAGIDRHIIEDIQQQNTSKSFIEKPWEEITIEQKIAYEDELNKEIDKTDKSIFNIFKPYTNNHKLAEFEFSALGKYQSNDDVLFRVVKQGFDKNFAVIHLTWKGKREIDGFPDIEFFIDFEAFKNLRMFPDKAEWEI
jgi:hypothetical protein